MADRERLPNVAEDHLLVGDQSGQPYRVDRNVPVIGRRRPDQRGGPRRGPARLVELAIVVKLDDLGPCHVLGRLRGELHHQRRADREVRGDEDICSMRVAELVGIEPRRPDHHVDTCGQRLAGVRDRRVRHREVDQHVGLGG